VAVRAHKQRSRKRKGMTLVEVMVALMVLSIVFLGMMASYTSSATINSGANARNRVLARTQQLMEEVMELSYEDALLVNGDAMVAEDGCVLKVSVTEVELGLERIEVYGCRLERNETAATLAGMTMEQVKDLRTEKISPVTLMTLKADH